MQRIFLYTFAAVITIAASGFAYYAISPLFITLEVNEGAPSGAVTMVEAEPASIVGTPAHPASGSVRIIEVDGKTYVRYENYQTINGPDIFVYLAKDLEASEYVNLGGVRATEGNVNYQVPEGVEISEYRYVLTWCRMFGVLFNYADLAS